MTRRARLGELMEERRLDLKMTWREVADAAGVTTETLRQIRAGSAQIQKLKQRGIEEALHWERGGIEAFLAGGEPPSPVPAAAKVDRALLREFNAEELYDRVVRDHSLPQPVRSEFAAAAARALQGLRLDAAYDRATRGEAPPR